MWCEASERKLDSRDHYGTRLKCRFSPQKSGDKVITVEVILLNDILAVTSSSRSLCRFILLPNDSIHIIS